MHQHGPDDPTGPVRGTSVWWHGTDALPPDEEAPVPPPTKKARRGPRRGGPVAIRTELVERVRREIAAGTYDSTERWEAALDRLLDRLARD